MQRTSFNISSENMHKENTLRSVSTETDTLKKQMATLKRSKDNASAENGRLSNELTDALADLTITKRKLKESQQEVERMKTQLREYVQEMQRAEELLFVKEREREEMLERYKSLSEGVNVLETSNHTLEVETSEAKKLLQEAEDRITSLEELVNVREQDIRECEHQISELSAKLAATELELELLREENHALAIDLEATKELCNKLDLQKDKLNEELQEHSNIREQLAREKGTLQKELTLKRTGDQAAVDGLQELLAASRTEVEQQRIAMAQLTQDTELLRGEMETLKRRLVEEQDKAQRSEALANEYSVQLLELRREITDQRFAQIRSQTADSTEHEEDDDDGNREPVTSVYESKQSQTDDNDVVMRPNSRPKHHRSNQRIHRDQSTQKKEPKMKAPSGWNITEYKRQSGEQASDSAQSGNATTTEKSIDRNATWLSLSYNVSGQKGSSANTGGGMSTGMGGGVMKGKIDDTGSTVIVYKTADGERLVLKNVELSGASSKGDEHRSMSAATKPGIFTRTDAIDGHTTAGIDFGAKSSVATERSKSPTSNSKMVDDSETRVERNWRQILLHQKSAGESPKNDGPDMHVPLSISHEASDTQPYSSRNYHLRFHMKLPCPKISGCVLKR